MVPISTNKSGCITVPEPVWGPVSPNKNLWVNWTWCFTARSPNQQNLIWPSNWLTRDCTLYALH